MIKSVIFLFFFLISFLNNNQEDEILKIIKGKQYSVHVKSELSFVNIHIPSGGVLRDKAVGVIFRNKEQFNLKTNNSIAIQEDSLFFILDPVLLIASLLKVESLGASILPLSLDPWDILNFCENNSKSKLIQDFTNRVVIQYLPIDTTALKSISIYFSKAKDSINNFKVVLIYQQRNNLVNHLIEYQKIKSVTEKMPLKIANYLENKGNKYHLNSNYKQYWFTNYFEFLMDSR